MNTDSLTAEDRPQTWMQKTRPRLLVLWGEYDLSVELTERQTDATCPRRRSTSSTLLKLNEAKAS